MSACYSRSLGSVAGVDLSAPRGWSVQHVRGGSRLSPGTGAGWCWLRKTAGNLEKIKNTALLIGVEFMYSVILSHLFLFILWSFN